MREDNGSNVRRYPGHLVALTMVVLVGILGAGCGSSSSSSSGIDDSAANHSAGGSSSASDQGMAVKFAECMRNNGVGDFPDPDSKGSFSYGVSVTPAVFTAAVKACKDLEPPGALSSKRSPEEQSAALKFAACIRAHGVKDFPDPVEGQPLVDTTKIPSTDEPDGMTILNAAMASCGDLVAKATAGQ